MRMGAYQVGDVTVTISKGYARYFDATVSAPLTHTESISGSAWLADATFDRRLRRIIRRVARRNARMQRFVDRRQKGRADIVLLPTPKEQAG